MKLISKRLVLFIFVLAIILGLSKSTSSQTNDIIPSDDWKINDFRSDITVNKDSSLDITEWITADCGECSNRHGIFRVLPLEYSFSDIHKTFRTPVQLKSITDFDGKSYHFEEWRGFGNRTITWKIGDPDRTVTGVNNYKISYHVKNAVLHNSDKFDELYWDLNGSNWELYILHYSATVTFPTDIKSNFEVNLYSGNLGDPGNSLNAKSTWLADNKLQIESSDVINPNSGITASITIPKGVIAPYQPTFWEKYGQYLFVFLPILTTILMLSVWKKYGRDYKIHAGIVPEFGSPDKLTPMQLNMVQTNGRLTNKAISAEIVNLAVLNAIKITLIPKSGIFSKADYELSKFSKSVVLNQSQKSLIISLFGVNDKIKLSTLKNKFYAKISDIEDILRQELSAKKLIEPKDRSRLFVITCLGFILVTIIFVLMLWLYLSGLYFAGTMALISQIILLIFMILMPRRGKDNATMDFRIKGFRYYMQTAERYRQKFNEKENIFERFLPYAVLFGITGLWARKMQQLYGQEYLSSYHPIWFVGGFDSFDVNSFTSSMNSIAAAVSSASTSPSSSGSGGGGFSGGGGGGGGGGGW